MGYDSSQEDLRFSGSFVALINIILRSSKYLSTIEQAGYTKIKHPPEFGGCFKMFLYP